MKTPQIPPLAGMTPLGVKSAPHFPAPVFPMHERFKGVVVIAYAHREALQIVPGKEDVYQRHEHFFYSARIYLTDDSDLYLIIDADGASVWKQPHVTPLDRYRQNPLIELLDLDKERDRIELAKRQARLPLKPKAPQSPCNFGLFSDDAKQTDLVGKLYTCVHH